MPIRLACACGKQLQVPDTAAGRKVRCPACQAVVIVPVSTPSAFEVVDTSPVSGSKPAPATKEEESRTTSSGAREEKAAKPTKRFADLDEDDDEEAPRKSRTKSAKTSDRDEEEDKPVSTKTGSKSTKRMKVEEEEEDEDEAEERPSKKLTKKKSKPDDDADDEVNKKAPRKKRPLWMILLGLGCGGFLLLTCLGVGTIGGLMYYVDSRQNKVAGKWVVDQNAPENAALPPINKAMQFEFEKGNMRCTMRVLGVDFLGKWSIIRNRENDAILVLVDFEEARGPDGQKVKGGKQVFQAAFEITPVDADHIDLVDVKDRLARMRMKKVTSFEKAAEPAKNLNEEFALIWKTR